MLKDPHLFHLCGCGGCNIYSHFQVTFTCWVSEDFFQNLQERSPKSSFYSEWIGVFLNAGSPRPQSAWPYQADERSGSKSLWIHCLNVAHRFEVKKLVNIQVLDPLFQRFESFLSPVFLLNLDIHGPNVKARQAIVSRTVFPHLSMAPQWNCIPRLQTFKAWL